MSTKPLSQLKAEIDYVVACRDAIHAEFGERSLDAEAQTKWDEAKQFLAAARAEVAAIEARHAEIAAIPAERTEAPAFHAPGIIVREDPYDFSDVRFGDDGALRSKALRAIDADASAFPESRHREEAERLVRTMPSKVAVRVAATSSPEYGRAFMKKVTGRESMWTEAERASFERAVALGGTANYAVPAPIDTTIIDTGSHSTNPFRQLATVKKIDGTYWTGVSSAGVTSSWDGEAAEVSDDAPTLAQVQIPTFKGQTFVPFSVESEDWMNLAADIYQMIAVGKDDLEGAAFATGNGTTAPQGIITGLDGTSSEIAPTTGEAFAKADIDKLIGSLQARYRKRAAFVANMVWYNAIRAFETTVNVGSLISTNPADYAGDFTLSGFPAYESSDMDAVLPNASATADNFGLLFGDLASAYYIVDRVGLNVELVPTLFHTSNNRPSGQRGFHAWHRTGAEVVNAAAAVVLSIPTAA